MRGKAQRDGRPGVELIETLVLLSLIAPKYTCNAAFRLITSCCNRKISGIKLWNHKIEIYVCPLHSLKLKSTLSYGLNIVWKCGEHLRLKYTPAILPAIITTTTHVTPQSWVVSWYNFQLISPSQGGTVGLCIVGYMCETNRHPLQKCARSAPRW